MIMKKLILLSVIVLLSLGNVTAQDIKFSLDPKTDKWGVSKGSTWLIKPKYTHKRDFDTQGFARPGIGYEYTEKVYWGLVDIYGNELVEPKYDEIGSFNQYRAVVKKDGYYGYIDTKGNEIIKPKYKVAHPFDNIGHAIVADVEYPKEQDYYKIDIHNRIVTENNIKRYSHKNGATSAKGKEINGKKVGEWKFYNTSSCLTAVEQYNNDGVVDGSYKRFFCFKYGYGENMNNNYPSQTGNYKNGKQDGLIVFYNPNNGKPTYSEIWENGVFKKVKDIYDSKGNLVSSTGTGILESYKEDSKYLSVKIEYQNGHRAGIAVWYHPDKTNSQIRQKALYKYDANDVNGLRWEVIEINDYNGNPLPKGSLKNGNGTWISYDDKDKPTIITTYQNGKKVKEETAVTKN